MTARTMAPQPAEDTGLRPLPWRRMAGVTWRQQRLALAGLAALLAALAAGLWLAGLQLHHAYAAAVSCRPALSPACLDLADGFNGANVFLANGILVQVVPPLAGAFLGAPVLARELESGTFRFAWTQGFGRWRWALAKLVLLAVAVAVSAAAFSLVLSWYYQPYFVPGNAARGLTEMTPFFPGLFDLRAVAFAGWTLAAFAVGALAGMLIRRVVPAIAATLAVYAGLAFAAAGFLRPHYLTALAGRNVNLPGSAWILGQWWTKGDSPPLSQSAVDQVFTSALQLIAPAAPSRAQKLQTYGEVVQYLTHHGYTQWTRYQPGSRFWPFQWIEGGWLLALSALLIAATVWLVRRRAA